MEDRKSADVRRRSMIALALSIFSFALAVDTFAETDQPATDAQRDAQNEAAISQTIEVMKARSTDQAAAKDRYDQMIQSAKAEHASAVDKCESLTDEAKKACKERADAEFSAAKSKANHALEADQSAQP
jgi:hypothetical protein